MAKNKRGNGEGTIYRRTDGRWSTQYTAYTGKRKTLYGRTRQGVAARLAKGPSDREGGLSFDRENLRLAEYLRHWLMDSVRDSVRAATYDGYDRQVRNYISPALGRIKLTALTPAHVRALYREKLDSGLSPRTVQYVHVTLRKALKQADDGLVPRNVAAAMKPPCSCGLRPRCGPPLPHGPKCAARLHRQAHDPSRSAAHNVRVPLEGVRQRPYLSIKGVERMRENDNLEEIFDRYVGLELLNRDWTRAPGAAGRSGRSADHARTAAEELSPQFRGEPLPQGVAGGT